MWYLTSRGFVDTCPCTKLDLRVAAAAAAAERLYSHVRSHCHLRCLAGVPLETTRPVAVIQAAPGAVVPVAVRLLALAAVPAQKGCHLRL